MHYQGRADYSATVSIKFEIMLTSFSRYRLGRFSNLEINSIEISFMKTHSAKSVKEE